MTHAFPTRRSSDLGMEITSIMPRLSRRRGRHWFRASPPRPRRRDRRTPNPTGRTSDRRGSRETSRQGSISPEPVGGGHISRRQRRGLGRSEEHTSELQSLMRISYAVFCLKKKNKYISIQNNTHIRAEKRKDITD